MPAADRTVLGFDYGRRRIGVAVGSPLTASARPLAILPARQQQPDWDGLARLITEWGPAMLVVGVPRHADGSASETTLAAERFARQLHGRFGLPVETIDERLSSFEAAERLTALGRAPRGPRQRRDGQGLDAAAAALILESWFNEGARP